MIDIGVNLTNKAFSRQLSAVLERAKKTGVSHCIVTGTSYEESLRAIELCEQFPQQLFATCGCHPHDASDFPWQQQESFFQLIEHKHVVAIGECGLDFNRNYSSPEDQLKVFQQHLFWAEKSTKPLFLHQRDAHSHVVELLKEHRHKLNKIVVHCFTDGIHELKDYLELDCYIGITGWITDERRNQSLLEAVSEIPINRLMIETDAPYLLPKNIHPKPQRRINEPSNLKYVLKALAEKIDMEPQYLEQQVTLNSKEFFQL